LLYNKWINSSNNPQEDGVPPEAAARLARRRIAVVAAAEEAGLLAGTNSQVGARVPRHLLEAAKARSGIVSTTDLVEYALAKVALEDDFGAKLVARKGSIPKDLDLEF
jgi:hypothetical protein